jgi:hypothetical protein
MGWDPFPFTSSILLSQQRFPFPINDFKIVLVTTNFTILFFHAALASPAGIKVTPYSGTGTRIGAHFTRTEGRCVEGQWVISDLLESRSGC